LYVPRSPFALPALVLAIAAGWWNCRALWINLAAVALVGGPIMGWQGNPLSYGRAPERIDRELCVVSCNIQGFQPNFELVVEELARIQPDVVAFQEVFNDHPLLHEHFRNWHVVRTDEYLVASRFPLELSGRCESAAFGRTIGIRVAVDAPQGKFLLYDIHLTSPRKGLNGLRTESGAEGIAQVKRELLLRGDEAGAARAFVAEGDPELPVLIAGDFNQPSDSRLFQDYWGDLTDAHKAAGVGYGYTSPCHTRRFWPSGCPWVRIDHILTDGRLGVRHCWTGANNGSDHRLVAARFEVRAWSP
jgi:vancomycin resistance protein VanJ